MILQDKIPFNRSSFVGNELENFKQAAENKKFSGDGHFTKKCHEFFKQKYNFKHPLLTTSCTDALELSALLLNIFPGDEIIMPSYSFVSCGNAFALRGAKIVFADSETRTPNIDSEKIEELITPHTKAILVIHYGGVACNMDKLKTIAEKHSLYIIEDAAHSIDSYYKGVPLGSIGNLGTFSFHETKNITCGEGGMILVNDEKFMRRAEIIREKGTNRSAFLRGEVDKYTWVDIGSSFLPSDLLAAVLYGQLEALERIQKKRLAVWNIYYEKLKALEQAEKCLLPYIPDYATNNAHLFYLVCKNLDERNALIDFLREKNIQATFHYLSLHKSPFHTSKHDGRELKNSDRFSDCLVRLPLFYELDETSAEIIADQVLKFYENRR